MTKEQREKARLRSLRWRRADGIGPRKPAQRPWLALGRRAKVRSQAALAAREAVLDRLQWQMTELRVSLERCAAAHELLRAELWQPPASTDVPTGRNRLSLKR
jgi:hypothetical protein